MWDGTQGAKQRLSCALPPGHGHGAVFARERHYSDPARIAPY